MKYIMLQHRQNKNKVPIIFPNHLVHITVWDTLCLSPEFGLQYDCISAGECTITCTAVHGKSTTLNLTFADGDSAVIDMMDYLHGL
jgi:hypothetical protein